MKFKVFASFIGLDWDGNYRPDPDEFTQFGWTDHELIVHSNSKENAAKKVWKWAKARGAKQRQIMFVDGEMWKSQKSYKTRTIK